MKRSRCCFLTLVGAVLFSGSLPAADLYFIDAHSQLDHQVEPVEVVIQQMDKAGVYRTILAARYGRQPGEVADLAEQHGERIVPAVRTKSGAYTRNPQKYYKKMRKQLDSGRFRAMAEVLMYHAQKGDKAPEVVVYPDDQRVVYALDAAMEQGWPFVIHIEFASLFGSKKERFMAKMEEMLKAHPEHPFALNHLGQLNAGEVRRLINAHKNIHFLTAHANPAITMESNQPWTDMFEKETLSAEWKQLVAEHSDRFIFALDNVWARHWEESYQKQMELWKKAMADLPPKVAHMFAHGNAERLWRLEPKR